MKKVRCPKCDNYTTFDENQYTIGQSLVFICPNCGRQFSIRIKESTINPEKSKQKTEITAYIIVIENIFHQKQEIPLKLGDNVIGRYTKGTTISTPIETSDPSVDTKHCIINIKLDKQGNPVYTLRDATSNTGTFYMNDILSNYDRIYLQDNSIITIGATTLIFKTK